MTDAERTNHRAVSERITVVTYSDGTILVDEYDGPGTMLESSQALTLRHELARQLTKGPVEESFGTNRLDAEVKFEGKSSGGTLYGCQPTRILNLNSNEIMALKDVLEELGI